MSRFSGLLFVIVCLCVMSSVAWAAKPGGLLAEWKFDEGKGDVAHDSSGKGHDAKIFGPTWVEQGKGFALNLDGFDDYVDCGESQAIGIAGPITIEAWVRPMRKGHGLAILFGQGLNSYLLTYYNVELCEWFIGGGSNFVRGSLSYWKGDGHVP